jgi:hypothetical protein
MSSFDLDRLIVALHEARVDFVIVGGAAAVLHGAPVTTKDLDIVHDRAPANVERLLQVLLALGAYNRADLANRRLPPTTSALSGRGHINLQTTFGPLDVLCELDDNRGYLELVPHSEMIHAGDLQLRVLDLPTLIDVKARAGRPKDRVVLPVLIATLEEKQKPR